MKHIADQVLHVTADTGKSTVVSLEEVNADALDVCIGLMEDILAGKTVDLPGKTGCSVSGRESDGKFSAELHHHDYTFPLVEVDVYPPEFEGSHAKSVSKLDGIVRLRDEAGGSVTQEVKDDVVLFGDVGRIVAWAWLLHEGYIDDGR